MLSRAESLEALMKLAKARATIRLFKNTQG